MGILPYWRNPRYFCFGISFKTQVISPKVVRGYCSQNGEMMMTQEQKTRILELAQAGFKDKHIAELLDLSVNTVKSHRQRNRDQVVMQNEGFSICPQCARPFAKGITGKRFCSETCKTKWWNQRHDLYKNTSAIQVTCLHCGATFSAYSKQNRLFCSRECYIAHRYARGGADDDKK